MDRAFRGMRKVQEYIASTRSKPSGYPLKCWLCESPMSKEIHPLFGLHFVCPCGLVIILPRERIPGR